MTELAGAEWPITDDEVLVGAVMRLDLEYNAKGYPVENFDEYVSDVPSEVTGVAPTGKPGSGAVNGAATNGSGAGNGASAPW